MESVSETFGEGAAGQLHPLLRLPLFNGRAAISDKNHSPGHASLELSLAQEEPVNSPIPLYRGQGYHPQEE